MGTKYGATSLKEIWVCLHGCIAVLAAALCGEEKADKIVARQCATANVLTCGLMGGALWTWPFGVCVPQGLLPGLTVLASSISASDRWMRLALCDDASERIKWHLAAASALATGALAARVLFKPPKTID